MFHFSHINRYKQCFFAYPFNLFCVTISHRINRGTLTVFIDKYDALGRRTEKTINGATTKYLYDGLDVIQEKDKNGAVTVNYIRTLNIDEPLTRIKGTTVRHYVSDALGSIIGLADDAGAIKTTYAYDPFGNTTISGEASDNPFQYTGRENDGTGLYYYRARYYSPDLQRFISEDPIGLEGGDVNYYAYVGNNPVNWVDPEGQASRPGIPGYWSVLAKTAPYLFCKPLQKRCNYAEEQNIDCKAIDGEDCWKVDPDTYKILKWCRDLGYIK